ncbi:hypothetical protein AAF712_014213 [Marasmius tenuissimus]|uniref:DUF6534 domain-containing protein n=1 Tax=Marasmius tenuissimus TaxID=585030 RepID=A0ABR2ZF62_9AGAR
MVSSQSSESLSTETDKFIALVGIMLVQVYVYYLSFKKDPIYIKALVYTLLILDLLQTGFATHYAWFVLAVGWGNPIALQETPWSLATVPIFTGILAWLVQLFYAYRITVLGDRRIPFIFVSAVLAVGGLVAMVFAIYGAVLSISIRDITKAAQLNTVVTVWLAGSVIVDVLLTGTLTIQLASRSNRKFKATRTIVHRAIRMSLETGAVVAVAVIVELLLFLNSSTTTWYFLLGLCLGKLYSNALLATLNSRAIFKGDDHNSSSVRSLVWSTATASQNPGVISTRDTSATHIQVSTHVQRDLELGDYPKVQYK